MNVTTLSNVWADDLVALERVVFLPPSGECTVCLRSHARPDLECRVVLDIEDRSVIEFGQRVFHSPSALSDYSYCKYDWTVCRDGGMLSLIPWRACADGTFEPCDSPLLLLKTTSSPPIEVKNG